MPRPRNAQPARKLHISLPGALGARLDLMLYSPAEQRVPFAAHQRFYIERTQEYFERSSLDLAPYSGDFAPGSVVYGPAPVIEMLKRKLEGR